MGHGGGGRVRSGCFGPNPHQAGLMNANSRSASGSRVLSLLRLPPAPTSALPALVGMAGRLLKLSATDQQRQHGVESCETCSLKLCSDLLSQNASLLRTPFPIPLHIKEVSPDQNFMASSALPTASSGASLPLSPLVVLNQVTSSHWGRVSPLMSFPPGGGQACPSNSGSPPPLNSTRLPFPGCLSLCPPDCTCLGLTLPGGLDLTSAGAIPPLHPGLPCGLGAASRF